MRNQEDAICLLSIVLTAVLGLLVLMSMNVYDWANARGKYNPEVIMMKAECGSQGCRNADINVELGK